MKKSFRIISLIIAIALTAISLCSCQALDEAKANQAFYTDSTKREVICKDNTYKLIRTGNLEIISTWDYGGAVTGGRYCTEKDVPALLSSLYGDWYTVNKDETVMQVGGSNYIREDKYDTVQSIIADTTLDSYFISYYVYNEGVATYEDYQRNILLDDDTVAAIDRTLDISANDKVKYDTVSDGYSADVITIYRCDKDMFLSDYEAIRIIRDSGKYYIWNGNVYNEYSICPVAEEDTELIEALFKDYPDAAQNDNIHWYFENNYYNYDTDEYEYSYDDVNVYL